MKRTSARIVPVAILLAASVVVTVLSLTTLGFDDTHELTPLAGFTAVLWALFAVSLVCLRFAPRKVAIVLVVVGSVAIGGAALAGPPNTSTDSARYAWDGIVQRAGVSPYEYVPADKALEGLHTDWLFPDAVDGECAGSRIMRTTQPTTGAAVCTAINRATVPTIYPPAAEIYFLGIRLVTGPDPTYLPSQLAGLLVSLTITAILLRTLVRRGRDPRWAAMWGWCPLVATEAVTNSHVDVLAALFLLLATVLVASKRPWLGGLALGLSIATKLIPVIGAPPLLKRGWWKITLAAVGVFALLYVPYVAASGVGVLGYLPGYLGEEGYGSGKRFVLLSLVAPGAAATPLAGIVIVVTVVLVWLKSHAGDPWVGETVLIGIVLLTVSPRYAWYALLLVPMIAMSGRWEWLVVPLALTERLLNPSVPAARIALGLAVVVIVVAAIVRMGPDARKTAGRAVRHPLDNRVHRRRPSITER